MRQGLFMLFCLMLPLWANAQGGSGTLVSGQVEEAATSEPLAFVNVILFRLADTLQVQGTLTDQEGRFAFSGIAPGKYFAQLSFLGFETKKTTSFSIHQETVQHDLGKIGIQVSAHLLEQVEVVAEKSTYSFSLDRKVYNVEKDILAQTGSATEILQNLPAVTVDADGQVSLRGTSNITFFINGKPSALMRANPTAALEQIPANTIERIEVITNPSARYRPDGIGGIINIVLKEKKGQGWNAVFLANLGNLQRYNANLNLNYGKSGLNAFLNYGIRHASTPRSLLDQRINKNEMGDILSNTNYSSFTQKESFSHLLSGGMAIELGEQSQLELSGEYQHGIDDIRSLSDWMVREEVLSAFAIDRTLDEREGEYELAATFEHEFQQEDHTLAIEFTYSNYDESEDNYYDESHTSPSVFRSLSRNLIEKGGPLADLSLDYALPIGEETELEAGYEAQFLKDNIHFLGEDFLDQDGSWSVDLDKTNYFIFRQDIHAIYSTLGHSFGDFSFLAGLRAEQALINSHLTTTGEKIPNDYFNIFPSLHLSYELGDDQELQLSYSRRINRPDSDEHNPFAEYEDPRNREAGNPRLKPENIHSLELGYQWQSGPLSIVPTLYYRYKYDAFTEFEEIVQDSVLQRTYVNLSSEQSSGMELILSSRLKEAVTLNFSANAFYNELDASSLGNTNNRSIFAWDAKVAVHANVTGSTLAQVNASYRSSRLSAQGRFRPLFLLNLGLRQDILRKSGSLILTVSDVFNSLKFKSLIDTPLLYRSTNYKRNSQIIYVGFVYRFGQILSKKQQKLDFEDNI